MKTLDIDFLKRTVTLGIDFGIDFLKRMVTLDIDFGLDCRSTANHYLIKFINKITIGLNSSLHASNELNISCKTHAILQIIRYTGIIEKGLMDGTSVEPLAQSVAGSTTNQMEGIEGEEQSAPRNMVKLKEHDFLGEAKCVLSEIMTVKNQSMTLKLHGTDEISMLKLGYQGLALQKFINFHFCNTFSYQNVVDFTGYAVVVLYPCPRAEPFPCIKCGQAEGTGYGFPR
ncbi:hypothetical protein LXL04_012777 [Taraxacum kok-saghyz]